MCRLLSQWRAAACFGTCLALAAMSAGANPIPADVTVNIEARIAAKDTAGIAIALVRPDGPSFAGFGQTVRPNGPVPDEDTVFEIGSVTKIFTALLLTDMVERGVVELETPVADLLPEDTRVPVRNGGPITLRMLASHGSGLPRIPTNIRPSDYRDPYADYTVDLLYEFLRGWETPEDAPDYRYSNLGYGLLGHALCEKADRPFEALVRDRITRPLKMLDTAVTLSPDMRRRLAQGYKGPLPMPGWKVPVLTGAGGLHSTARDMATLLEAFLGFRESPLKAAMDAMMAEQGEADLEGVKVCLGWHLLDEVGSPIYRQNGVTGGYNSFVGFSPGRQLGVVVLSNSTDHIEDIGLHLLEPAIPLRKARDTYAVDAEWLRACEGRYRFAPGVILVTRVVDGMLVAKLNEQNTYPVYPVSDTRFTYRAVPAELEFERNDDGEVTSVVLHQNGQEQRGQRVPGP